MVNRKCHVWLVFVGVQVFLWSSKQCPLRLFSVLPLTEALSSRQKMSSQDGSAMSAETSLSNESGSAAEVKHLCKICGDKGIGWVGHREGVPSLIDVAVVISALNTVHHRSCGQELSTTTVILSLERLSKHCGRYNCQKARGKVFVREYAVLSDALVQSLSKQHQNTFYRCA